MMRGGVRRSPRRLGIWLLALGTAALGGGQPSRPIDVRDGFEAPALSALWTTERALPGAIELQSAVVRSGHGAVAVTLRPGDQLPDEAGTELERAELMEARDLVSREGGSYAFSFSLFLPAGFPIVPTRLVLAQWKQYCPSGRCGQDNPVLALRYQDGEFRVTLHAGSKTTTLYRTREEIRGRWQDFSFQVRFSRTGDGRVLASRNGAPLIDYRGATCYSEADGFPPGGLFYFKVGLYRDRTPATMRVYIDDYEKKELSAPGLDGRGAPAARDDAISSGRIP